MVDFKKALRNLDLHNGRNKTFRNLLKNAE
jgi:hypothetical protein